MAGDNGWRKWTNHILFTLLLSASTVIIVLFNDKTNTNINANVNTLNNNISNLKEIVVTNDSRHEQILQKTIDKVDKLCTTVQSHEMQLKMDYKQRKAIQNWPSDIKKIE